MGCAQSAEVKTRLDSIDEKLGRLVPDPTATNTRHVSSSALARQGSVFSKTTTDNSITQKTMRDDGKYDIFVSHAKKLLESEDRAVWVCDVAEGRGLRAFFDRSDLLEITEAALKEALLVSDVLLTVIDPFTFNSQWVFKENLFAANLGIPIVCV